MADLPDNLLRRPRFVPSKPRPDYRAHHLARTLWLEAHGVTASLRDLDEERRRRWPLVDRVRIVGSPKGDL